MNPIIIKINKHKFTNTKEEFSKGGYTGYCKVIPLKGVLFMDENKEPQALLIPNTAPIPPYFVTAYLNDNKRVRHLSGLMAHTRSFLGLSHTDNFTGIAADIWNEHKHVA